MFGIRGQLIAAALLGASAHLAVAADIPDLVSTGQTPNPRNRTRTGSEPVSGGGQRQRERNLRKMAKAAAKASRP